jgi:NAD dependent epimerase/dehydratase family enzyme
VSGAVNLTAPGPCTNATFTKALGEALHRPTIMRIPRLVTRVPLGIGDLAESLLFSSARVLPAALLRAGYPFADTEIGPALRGLVGKDRASA